MAFWRKVGNNGIHKVPLEETPDEAATTDDPQRLLAWLMKEAKTLRQDNHHPENHGSD